MKNNNLGKVLKKLFYYGLSVFLKNLASKQTTNLVSNVKEEIENYYLNFIRKNLKWVILGLAILFLILGIIKNILIYFRLENLYEIVISLMLFIIWFIFNLKK